MKSPHQFSFSYGEQENYDEENYHVSPKRTPPPPKLHAATSSNNTSPKNAYSKLFSSPPSSKTDDKDKNRKIENNSNNDIFLFPQRPGGSLYSNPIPLVGRAEKEYNEKYKNAHLIQDRRTYRNTSPTFGDESVVSNYENNNVQAKKPLKSPMLFTTTTTTSSLPSSSAFAQQQKQLREQRRKNDRNVLSTAGRFGGFAALDEEGILQARFVTPMTDSEKDRFVMKAREPENVVMSPQRREERSKYIQKVEDDFRKSPTYRREFHAVENYSQAYENAVLLNNNYNSGSSPKNSHVNIVSRSSSSSSGQLMKNDHSLRNIDDDEQQQPRERWYRTAREYQRGENSSPEKPTQTSSPLSHRTNIDDDNTTKSKKKTSIMSPPSPNDEKKTIIRSTSKFNSNNKNVNNGTSNNDGNSFVIRNKESQSSVAKTAQYNQRQQENEKSKQKTPIRLASSPSTTINNKIESTSPQSKNQRRQTELSPVLRSKNNDVNDDDDDDDDGNNYELLKQQEQDPPSRRVVSPPRIRREMLTINRSGNRALSSPARREITQESLNILYSPAKFMRSATNNDLTSSRGCGGYSDHVDNNSNNNSRKSSPTPKKDQRPKELFNTRSAVLRKQAANEFLIQIAEEEEEKARSISAQRRGSPTPRKVHSSMSSPIKPQLQQQQQSINNYHQNTRKELPSPTRANTTATTSSRPVSPNAALQQQKLSVQTPARPTSSTAKTVKRNSTTPSVVAKNITSNTAAFSTRPSSSATLNNSNNNSFQKRQQYQKQQNNISNSNPLTKKQQMEQQKQRADEQLATYWSQLLQSAKRSGFAEGDLVRLSWGGLKGLLDHFGIVHPVQVAQLQLLWRKKREKLSLDTKIEAGMILNVEQVVASSSSLSFRVGENQDDEKKSTRNNNQNSKSTPTSPLRKSVTFSDEDMSTPRIRSTSASASQQKQSLSKNKNNTFVDPGLLIFPVKEELNLKELKRQKGTDSFKQILPPNPRAPRQF